MYHDAQFIFLGVDFISLGSNAINKAFSCKRGRQLIELLPVNVYTFAMTDLSQKILQAYHSICHCSPKR